VFIEILKRNTYQIINSEKGGFSFEKKENYIAMGQTLKSANNVKNLKM